jgi:hypothetical protein
MAKADDYKLVVSGLGGVPYISKVSKAKQKGLKEGTGVMLSDRRQIPEEEFINALLQWAMAKIDDPENSTVFIRTGDSSEDIIAEIKLNIDKIV